MEPFPLYAERGSGARVELIDGAEVDDFLLNYSASALGHCHPAVTAAIHRGVDAGGPFGLSVPAEVQLAERMRERFTGVELVRFTNSGSEATLQAVRAARAFSGRPRIAKAEGGYHGSHDLVDVGITRFGESYGEAIGETRGMAPEVVAGVSVFPYNDLDGALAVLEPQAEQLAGVLIEVFLNSSGVIPARPEFLHGIAEWCAAHGVLLILDEVASWRTGYRGAGAEHHGLRPDLICLGKALGGGFPIGALGGRAEVMAMFDPRGGSIVRHAGTFNGHPVAMSAGLAVLEALDEPAIARMNAQGGGSRRGRSGSAASRGWRSPPPTTAASVACTSRASGPARRARQRRSPESRASISTVRYWSAACSSRPTAASPPARRPRTSRWNGFSPRSPRRRRKRSGNEAPPARVRRSQTTLRVRPPRNPEVP